MDIIVLLQQAVLNHASDIFVVAGLPVSYRANGRICREKEEKLMPKILMEADDLQPGTAHTILRESVLSHMLR